MRHHLALLQSLAPGHIVHRLGRGLALVAVAAGVVYLGHLAVGCKARPVVVELQEEDSREPTAAAAIAADDARVASPTLGPPSPATATVARPAEPSSSPHDAELEELIAGLSPTLRQRLSDALYLYGNARTYPEEAPRAVLGPTDAPVRIVVWGDILCRQCALLHDTLGYVRSQAPPGTMSLELRQYPLEGHCNPRLEKREEHSLHCTAAKMVLCAEGSGHEFELLTAFYRNQASLPRELAMEMAAAFIGWDRITACLHDPDLEGRLGDDVDYAARVDAQVLPFVLLNGRRAPAFGPFLYAMCLSRGSTDHPAFDALPPAHTDADFELSG